jgi:hypothetical protein
MNKRLRAAILLSLALIGFLVVPLAEAGPSRTRQQGRSSGPGGGVFLSMYREQTQGAFTLLVPKGWKTEGGMVPSGASWNVVDLVESNIKFRVTSPDGLSFFGWYPRFYFQDPSATIRSSGGILQVQPGQVIGGVWQYPYMNIENYVQHIVFGQFAKEFQSPRLLGPARPCPDLKAWVPQGVSHHQAGFVNFECSIGGVPMLGRIYTIIYNLHNIAW